jgi:phosphoribosyl 1,2-cyclic phosphodiesterase
VKVRFWGVRGSFAMTGREVLRYGGNTTSVELQKQDGKRLLIDLGTGATEFAKQLMAGDFGKGCGELTILLSHTHLDHIQGLPFFTPFFVKGNRIRILGANSTSVSLQSTLQNQLSPHYSPLNGLENLAAGVSIETFTPGATLTVDGFSIVTAAMPHGSMWTTAFRVTADAKTVVFLSDVEYPDPTKPLDSAIALAAGADLLIHDAMHADHQYEMRRGWGHSAVQSGIAVAEAAGSRRLALFHHSPDATDDMIDNVVARAKGQTAIDVFAAAEGSYISLD